MSFSKFIYALLWLIFTPVFGQFYQEVDPNLISPKGEEEILPQKYESIQWDVELLRKHLNNCSKRFDNQEKEHPVLLEIPNPDGEIITFKLLEVETMHPDLAARYPDIKTYLGTHIKNPTQRLRLQITHKGIHAMVRFGEKGTFFIDPFTNNDIRYGKIYWAANYWREHEFSCQTDTDQHSGHLPKNQFNENHKTLNNFDGFLRKYRLAVAATGEYTVFHGGSVADGLAAVVVCMDRANDISEVDLGVTYELIPDNDNIIFTSPFSDPYYDYDFESMLDANEVTLDLYIGVNNYDIGHVFSRGSGGLAWLQGACNEEKARGASGLWQPINDQFYIEYVCHELGHQLGGTHTFNNDCNGNSTPGASMEVGSGTTILSYGGGGCFPAVVNSRDFYYHGNSIRQIRENILYGYSSGCVELIPIDNSAPVMEPLSDYFIPKSTPFTLSAVATDIDGDALTYCWEQMDPEYVTQPPVNTSTAGPTFRNRMPSTATSRTYPQLSGYVIDPLFETWEILPNVARDLHFMLTVRDNNVEGGAVLQEKNKLNVVGTAGPFVVYNPSSDWSFGESRIVTWSVAQTNQAPINCENVSISLSTDGGLTYPIVLAASTPNDGSHTIVVPEISSAQSRIKVESIDNVFFNINLDNFQVVNPGPSFSLIPANESIQICGAQSITQNLSLQPIQGFSGAVSLTASGGPSGTTVNFSNNNLTLPSNTNFTIGIPANASSGDYPITVTASGNGMSNSSVVLLKIENNLAVSNLLSPFSSETNVSANATLNWLDIGAENYTLEIATDPNFNSIVLGQSTAATSFYLSEPLSAFSTYYWRITAQNACGSTNSNSSSFTTGIANYCESLGLYSFYEWIEAVQVGPLNNTSGNNGGFGTFNYQATTFTAGETYPITLTPGFQPDPYDEYWKVWIDYNNDGSFSETELAFDAGFYSDETVSGNITIPTSAPSSTTIMRVAMKWSNGAEACEFFDYGEVEDYIISIVNNDVTACADSDEDGVCDVDDLCPGYSDLPDVNNNGLPDNCEPILLNIKAFLEGPYEEGTNEMTADLSSQGLLSVSHPYTIAPYNMSPQNASTIPFGTVDWVIVEVRTGLQPSDEFTSKMGFLMANGQVKDLNGVSDLQFDLPPNQDYYVVLRHRNHLDVISAQPLARSLNMAIDFTANVNNALGNQAQKLASDGQAVLFSGDLDHNHVIQTTDYDKWALDPAQVAVYQMTDLNLDGIVQTTDFDLWFNNKSKIGVAELGY